MKIYHAPNTRAVRIVWLFEELGLPYELERFALGDPAMREPAYLELHRTGELKRRGEELWAMMKSCALCPRECGADRLGGDEGFCRASAQLLDRPMVSPPAS